MQKSKENSWYRRHKIFYEATTLRIKVFKFKKDQEQNYRIQEQV